MKVNIYFLPSSLYQLRIGNQKHSNNKYELNSLLTSYHYFNFIALLPFVFPLSFYIDYFVAWGYFSLW